MFAFKGGGGGGGAGSHVSSMAILPGVCEPALTKILSFLINVSKHTLPSIV